MPLRCALYGAGPPLHDALATVAAPSVSLGIKMQAERLKLFLDDGILQPANLSGAIEAGRIVLKYSLSYRDDLSLMGGVERRKQQKQRKW